MFTVLLIFNLVQIVEDALIQKLSKLAAMFLYFFTVNWWFRIVHTVNVRRNLTLRYGRHCQTITFTTKDSSDEVMFRSLIVCFLNDARHQIYF